MTRSTTPDAAVLGFHARPATPATPAVPLGPAVQTLPHGQALRLPAEPGRVLEVLSGRLWLTLDGGGHDHFLRAGDRWPLQAGPLVIESDGGADARWRSVKG